jgi:mono/diheme cytochrome c family protein
MVPNPSASIAVCALARRNPRRRRFANGKHLVILLCVAILLGVALQARAAALSDSPANPDVTEGDRLAHILCVNCHVVDLKGPVIRTDRVPSFSWIANQEGLTPTTLPAWLSTAHERMPDLSLTRNEIRQVSAYIMSLRQ